MTENLVQGDMLSSFTFEWGTVRLELSGREELIREAFALLREEIMPSIGSAATRAVDGERRSDTRVSDGATSNRDTSSHSGSALSPAQLCQEKKPKTEQEKATVLAFYLKEYRNVTEFTVPELEGLFNEAHVPIKNVQNAVWNAGRKSAGWIKVVPGKRNVYHLTAAGESYVRTQLPKA